MVNGTIKYDVIIGKATATEVALIEESIKATLTVANIM